jgi:hypothetical protein
LITIHEDPGKGKRGQEKGDRFIFCSLWLYGVRCRATPGYYHTAPNEALEGDVNLPEKVDTLI